MSKLLTVAIPTFNRRAKLERQLAWLQRNIVGLADVCEIIVSDNASTDDTAAACARWKAKFASQGVQFRVNCNTINLGPLPNIARCIEMAESRFVWVIGDDDEIPDEKLAWVVARLAADPDLASIVLNFEGVGKTVYPRCFNFPADRIGDGLAVMSECLRQAYFGLAFMTAQVYRTEFARRAMVAWPNGLSNYDFQVFVTAFTALHGRVLATRDTHVKYVTGDNVYEKNKRIGLILYADSLEVFQHLHRVGYSGELCRYLARRHLWGLKRRFIKRALQNNPLLTLATLARAGRHLAGLMSTRLSSHRRRNLPSIVVPA